MQISFVCLSVPVLSDFSKIFFFSLPNLPNIVNKHGINQSKFVSKYFTENFFSQKLLFFPFCDEMASWGFLPKKRSVSTVRSFEGVGSFCLQSRKISFSPFKHPEPTFVKLNLILSSPVLDTPCLNPLQWEKSGLKPTPRPMSLVHAPPRNKQFCKTLYCNFSLFVY